MVRTRTLTKRAPPSFVVSRTWSMTPASAGRRASEASRLVKRCAPVVSSGKATYTNIT